MFACCAFAVFLLQQLLMPIALLRERLFGKAASRANASVMWAPGAAAALPTSRRMALRPTLVLVLALETLAIGGSVAAATLAAQSARHSIEQQFLITLHAYICHAVGSPYHDHS